jgi:hypothetical protein
MSSFRLFDKFGVDGCKIVLLELYPCSIREELQAQEGHWIQQLNCVNRCIAGQTEAEWRANNREHIAKKDADYYEQNKDSILKRQAEWREQNRAYIAKRNADYRESNRLEINARRRKRYLDMKSGSPET